MSSHFLHSKNFEGNFQEGFVHPGGLEPPTCCSEDSRSIQLSYGCKYLASTRFSYGCRCPIIPIKTKARAKEYQDSPRQKNDKKYYDIGRIETRLARNDNLLLKT